MPQVTKFGVLPIFRGLEGKLMPQRVIIAVSAGEAKRKAALLASVLGGALAFTAESHPELDAWEPLKIIARFGEVPESLMEADIDPSANS
jgi:hypothetical protein